LQAIWRVAAVNSANAVCLTCEVRIRAAAHPIVGKPDSYALLAEAIAVHADLVRARLACEADASVCLTLRVAGFR
jgi:hypothetical protein